MSLWEKFPEFDHPAILHGFSRRFPAVEYDRVDGALRGALSEIGLEFSQTVHAAQTHGNGVAKVEEAMGEPVPDVDALITNRPGLALVVRVADCGPVFFHDPTKQAIGVAHSGRKGTEANIVEETIRGMVEEFGCERGALRVHLGPCIRPPHYDPDFAAEIGRQVREAGVTEFHDCEICTGENMDRYYSYRREKGKTGRMWGVLMLRKDLD